jgi:xanthine/CO dehydrogenase XdhC/CoxF family maturation factor
MNNLDILKQINEDFAVATVVWAKPGSEVMPGDKLFLTSSGRIFGNFKSANDFVLTQLKKILNSTSPIFMDYVSCDAEGEATCGTKFQMFLEYYGNFPKVHIFGAGDIGIFTHHLLKSLDFNSFIYDDDNLEENIVLIKYNELKVPISEKDYVVIVTRGHRNDYDVLKYIFDLPYQPKYLGLLGSKRKNDILKDKLFDEGYTIKYWDNVKTPIGLDSVKAQTPKEIAVAIVAEILSFKNGGDL